MGPHRIQTSAIDHLDSSVFLQWHYKPTMKVKLKIREYVNFFSCSICWSLNYVSGMFWGWTELHYIDFVFFPTYRKWLNRNPMIFVSIESDKVKVDGYAWFHNQMILLKDSQRAILSFCLSCLILPPSGKKFKTMWRLVLKIPIHDVILPRFTCTIT